MQILAIIGPWQIVIILIVFLPIIGMWRIFNKANKPGWSVLIPIYNAVTLTEIIGKPGWWALLMYIPYLNVIWIIWGLNLLVKSFGKTEAFTVGVIFLGFIFVPILGFDNSKYIGPYGSTNKSINNKF